MTKEVVIFTGGGSGGHVVPALTIIENLNKEKYEIHYIGSKNGIEAELTNGKVDTYHFVSVGKLRRYISVENFIDIFKVFVGLIQSIFLILKIKSKNSIVISMGGFVSVPVVIAAKINGVKVYIHEQTTRVGLANKICSKFADKVMVSFEDSLKFFPQSKVVHTGYPVRKRFYDKEVKYNAVEDFVFHPSDREVLFITGGGNGSLLVNEKVKESLKELKSRYKIIHQVGKAHINEYVGFKDEHYLPVAFLGDEMPSIYKCADIVISRAGAGTVCELMALNKRSIFIPLKIAQKNEQYHNAVEAKKKLGSLVIEEDEFKKLSLIDVISTFTPYTEDTVISFENSATQKILKECDLILDEGI